MQNLVVQLKLIIKDCAASADNEDAYAVPMTDTLDLQPAEKDYELPPHFKCAVHKLSLVATKDSGLALADTQYKKLFRSLHGKLSAMWFKQTTSVVASDKIR